MTTMTNAPRNPATAALHVPDTIAPDTPPLEAALAYAKAGWYVVPVAIGSKNPGSVVGKNWTSKSTRDPQIIADYWMMRGELGIALHVGRSGALVLDVDTPTKLPDVLTDALTSHPAPFQRTRRNDAARRHYIYAQPPGRTFGNGLGKIPTGWGDLRGTGGVIIVAPSVHPDTDGHYQWGRTGPVPLLPQSITDLLGDSTQPLDVATDSTIRAFITLHDHGTDLDKLRTLTATYKKYVKAGDSRHQRAVSILAGALKEAAAGYYPATLAEEQLREAFLDAVAHPGHGQQGTPRTGAQAIEEWRGILAWAVAQAAHADILDTIDRAEDHGARDLSTLIDTRPTPPTVTGTDGDGAELEHTDEDDQDEAATPAAPMTDLDRLLNPDSSPAAAGIPLEDPPSWRPVDLTTVLDGTYQRPEPTIMPRTDGPGLFYPGKVHTVYGESESGKSWIAQHAVTTTLDTDGRVLYIDFESDAPDVTGRLTALGTGREQLLSDAFAYVRPEASPHTFAEAPEFAQLLTQDWTLCILDGVTEALGLSGKSTMDNDEITAWMRDIPRTIARATGAAVILVDHVVKSQEGRGRFPIGGQAKMAAIDGTGYLVEPLTALGQGLDGSLTIRVTKDRPGTVRAHAGDWRKTDRTQEAARIRLDSSTGDGSTRITVQPPEYGEMQARDNDQPFRPTKVMEKVSRILETMREPLSLNKVSEMYRESGAKAKRTTIIEGINLLVESGHVAETEGPRNARLFRSASVYRSHTDSLSGDFTGDLDTFTTTSSRPVPTSSENQTAPVPNDQFLPPLSTRGGTGRQSRTEPPNPTTSSQTQDTYINPHTGEIHGEETTP